jgi:PKHD-type hydroxylase
MHTINNFLTYDECSDILNKYKSELELKPAIVVNNDNKVRKSSVAWIDNIDLVDEKLINILKNNIQVKGYEVTGLGPYQFTEYKTGEYYGWHMDSDPIFNRDRYCSIVIQLNDEYDGGYLELMNEDKKSTHICQHGTGTLFIFYSHIEHRVTEITNGTRYSLVNWISLKKINNFQKTLI